MQARGHACLGGMCGMYASLLWTEFLTHVCENITFPQLLLRAVMNNYTGHSHNEFVNTFIRVAKHFIYATKCQSKKLNFTYVEICARQEVDRCHTWGKSEESIACRQWSMQVNDPPYLWKPGQMSAEVWNRGISDPAKSTNVLQKVYNILK